jgi:outer membrane protein
VVCCAGALTERAHAQRGLEITAKERSGNPSKPAPDVSKIDVVPIETADADSAEQKRWFARIGVVAAAYHPGASIRTSGQVIPGGTASASSNFTTTFEVGYDVTKNITASMCVGLPPKPHIDGRGTVAPLGTLGKVRYGPAIFTGYYRFPKVAGFRPYAGGGAAYAIILKEFDGAVTQLNAHNNWGSVLQGGVERKLTRKLDLFVDFKEVWLSVNAEGFLGGNVPVKARVKLDPSLVSLGIKFHFR